MNRFLALALALPCLFIFATPASAVLEDGACQAGQQKEVATTHSASIGGQHLSYTATTGFIEATALDGTSKACVFYTSYVVDAPGGAQRPLLFAFNGGPGSASLWLHMGLLGPKRVDLGTDGLSAVASPSLSPIENPNSPLDITDIVVIDPVATGFSHTEGTATSDKFFGVHNDYTSIESFIQNYLNSKNRWASPKFIMGESYGGIRGSLLAHHLQTDYGIAIKGLVLISPALANATFDPAGGNMIPYWTNFPNFATTAWYHKKIASQYQADGVDTVYQKAKKFAWEQLRNALDAGDELDAKTTDTVAQGIADFTGLSKETVLANDLRIGPGDMFSGLMAKERLAIGRYDARFTSPVVPASSDFDSYKNWIDPSAQYPLLAFTAVINTYLRGELSFNLPTPYVLTAKIDNWPEDDNRDGGAQELGLALAANPQLQIMIASGYFDLACPMGGVDYELSEMPRGALFSSRIRHTKYFGGHMMYINPPALAQLKNDLRGFMVDAISARKNQNRDRQIPTNQP